MQLASCLDSRKRQTSIIPQCSIAGFAILSEPRGVIVGIRVVLFKCNILLIILLVQVSMGVYLFDGKIISLALSLFT